MSNEQHNRTMMGISPFRAEDDDLNNPPAEIEARTTGERPVVAPVSLSDDGGWDLPDALPLAVPSSAAASAAPATSAAGSVAVDVEAASLRGGTMMLSGAAFQAAMAEMHAGAAASGPAPTGSPEQAAAAVEGIGLASPTAEIAKLNSTVRLSAVDFERLMTSGAQPSEPSAQGVALSKHAMGSEDLTDARVALPSRPNPAAAPASSVAARVADNRAAAAKRGDTAPTAPVKSQNKSMVYVVSGALVTLLIVGGALLWLFVVNR